MNGLLLGVVVMFFPLSNVCLMLQMLFPSLVLAYGLIFGQSLLPEDLKTKRIGGRVRVPSPLIHQWIEFRLQTATALPFKQEVIPGASPSARESTRVKLAKELLKGKPSLDTNLIAAVPPAEILARCEFLEPLSEATLSDYEWLIANLQKPASVLMKRVQHYLLSLLQSFLAKATVKS